MKSIKGIKVPTPEEMKKRIAVFEDDYDYQMKKIEEKLHKVEGKRKERLEEFKKDLHELKKMSDHMKEVMNKEGFRGKLSKAKFISVTSRKYLVHTLRFMRKYKKENCDVINF